MHVRVISPPERTEAATAALLEEVGATHVVVLRGAAVAPAGDVVEADVTREAVDAVLGKLCQLGLDRAGGITVEAVETTLSDSADAAVEAAPGDPADAVIWDDIVARSGEESRMSVSYQAFLTIACVLAAIGAITDSPVTVVGAMVLGPEFGPLAAIAVGLVLRRSDLVRRGAAALYLGFPLAMLVTAGAALLFTATGLLTSRTLDSLRQVEFIYEVGPFSFLVALLAGAAGMMAMTSAKSASLVGVFISVTTVPAAAVAAVGLVEGDLARAGGSALQLLVNLFGIVVAAAAVLLATRRAAARRPMRRLTSG